MAGTKTQGTRFQVATAAGSPKTITAITAANPPVVTSSAHGLTNGTIVLIAGVVGMTELNGRVFVIRNQATNTFELGGIDATGYTAYVSGGTATSQTMSDVGKVTDSSQFDGTADDIIATHMRSTAVEKQQGLPDFGGGSYSLLCDNTDTAQAKMRALKAAQTSGCFAIVATDTKVATFMAFVKSFTATFASNNIVRSEAAISYEVEPSWFA
jgi:hypothetical protein